MGLHCLFIIVGQQTHDFIQVNLNKPFPFIFWPENDGHPPLLVRKSYLFSTKNGTFYFPSNSPY